jgi:Ca-activated chloride channel family protein
MTEALQYFHFMRPFWLLLMPVILLMWWLIRPHRAATPPLPKTIAPHLAAALRVGSEGTTRLWPIDGVCTGLVLITLAVAGPAWNRVPNPLIADTAPLVVAIKVTDSMLTPDLAPTRLDRARFKVLDLIGQRAGARTALVAYAGSAHSVSPLTEDPNILRPLLEGLDPKVMPKPGANAADALAMATEILGAAETAGAILFVLDDLDPADVAAFNAVKDRPPVVFLLTLPAGKDVAQLGQIDKASVVNLTADGQDIAQVERLVRAAYLAALADNDQLKWDDRGWMLTWPAALLVLLWFRRGWTMRWAMIGTLSLTLFSPGLAQADGLVDWFATPDQQGQIAFNNKKFNRAAELFEDPYWRGYSMLKAGQYVEAGEVFARLDSPEAAFAEGLARIRNREYRPAIAAYETALVRRPDYPEAETNLEIAKAILKYVEDTREASDTGEESGLGADDVVFDNEGARGVETRIEGPEDDSGPLTAEQWMSSIDTDMTDFLHTRFLLENEMRSQ